MSLFLSVFVYFTLGVSFIVICNAVQRPKKIELVLMFILWPIYMMLVALILVLTKPQEGAKE